MNPPIAKKERKELIAHNDVRIDDYFWLKERENSEVIDYLNAENEYTDFEFKNHQGTKDTLFEELKSRIKKDDDSVPVISNGYYYQSSYEKTNEYPVYYRWKTEQDTTNKEVLFDVNKLAEGHKFYKLNAYEVSPDNKLVAYAVDTNGDRKHDIFFKNIETDELLSDKLENVSSNIEWLNDNKTILYVKYNESMRSYQVVKHLLGDDVSSDKVIYQEDDEIFDVYVYKSSSEKYVFVMSGSSEMNEFHYMDARDSDCKLHLIQKRKDKLDYDVEHHGDYFYIRTDADNSFNYKVVRTPISSPSFENWEDIVEHREDVLIEEMHFNADFFVLSERKNALKELSLHYFDEKGNVDTSEYLKVDEDVYTLDIHLNYEYKSSKLRYAYSSLTTPYSIFDYDVDTKEKTLLKEREVAGGKFDKANYISERIWVEARDGKKIPVSLVRHINTTPSENTPLLQYGYGSYGITVDPYFTSTRLSLLDRGFIFAIAHIRGSKSLGKKWYEDGKYLHKKNTFYDFIDVSKYLIDNKYTSPNHLYAQGGSAGGLLMGAVMNLEPKLYKGVIAQVPFVDVVTTMLDDTLPLTTGEYVEWGNPNDKTYYEYMKSYSPYDNVEKKEYPNVLVTTGLYDSQVQYWEPAKWVAKLRDMKTDDNKLMMYINMDVGHGGNSGRFASLIDSARIYTFLLMLEEEQNSVK